MPLVSTNNLLHSFFVGQGINWSVIPSKLENDIRMECRLNYFSYLFPPPLQLPDLSNIDSFQLIPLYLQRFNHWTKGKNPLDLSE